MSRVCADSPDDFRHSAGDGRAVILCTLRSGPPGLSGPPRR